MSSSKQEFWRTHLENVAASDLSVKEYCEQNNLSAPTLYYWKRRFAEVDTCDGGFDEIDVAEPTCEAYTIDLGRLDHTVLCRIVQAVVGQQHA